MLDLLHVLVKRPRPVREGHKPNSGRERTGEVGLRRSTREPAEQGRATSRGGKDGIQAGDLQQVNYLWTWVHQLKFTALPLHRG